MDDAASRRLGRRVIHGPHELVEVIQKLHVVRFGDGEMPVVEEHGVVIEARPANGTVAGVARSLEITNCDGSSPCAIMVSSTFGSLRMNSPEKPPMVDCRMIDTIGCPCLARMPGVPGRPFLELGRSTAPAGSSSFCGPASAGCRSRFNTILAHCSRRY